MVRLCIKTIFHQVRKKHEREPPLLSLNRVGSRSRFYCSFEALRLFVLRVCLWLRASVQIPCGGVLRWPGVVLAHYNLGVAWKGDSSLSQRNRPYVTFLDPLYAP